MYNLKVTEGVENQLFAILYQKGNPYYVASGQFFAANNEEVENAVRLLLKEKKIFEGEFLADVMNFKMPETNTKFNFTLTHEGRSSKVEFENGVFLPAAIEDKSEEE